ncbi:hypothetical protein CEXT_805581 [Caerostris extrusa]|uniref:Uncharacterized protein n=1 Tax=Caerostris extrusa TaxID=172846 RepID=A0AAV4WCF0_CAEEX|nr:hypothetical protein CEXT_805581 [Caerostris extrusa]
MCSCSNPRSISRNCPWIVRFFREGATRFRNPWLRIQSAKRQRMEELSVCEAAGGVSSVASGITLVKGLVERIFVLPLGFTVRGAVEVILLVRCFAGSLNPSESSGLFSVLLLGGAGGGC